MIDMRYKPYFLPQVSAPFDLVLQKLDDEGVGYDMVELDPNELNGSQGVTFSDEVGGVSLDDMNPIWVDEENNILDGHHRWVKAMMSGNPIKGCKLHTRNRDACRLLNKIQDIYEYEQKQGLEEVEVQDTINYYGDDENQFLTSLEEDNAAVQA